jgi:predicted RNase H-like nuclease (RuvC/YqgF family)
MLAGGETAAVARARELQEQLEARDAEAAALRRRCASLQEQVAAAQQAAGAAEVQRLQRQVAALQEELAAFDPAFFDEIEDLKLEHHHAMLRCAQYEEELRRLRG